MSVIRVIAGYFASNSSAGTYHSASILEVAIVGRRFGGVRGIVGLDRPLLLLGAGPERVYGL